MSKTVEKRNKIKKKIEKKFAGLLRYYSNVSAYQVWEGSVESFSVQKDYKFDFRQTDARHEIFITAPES